MPKRTNEFQQLITVIYRQMAPSGATVEESALLEEPHGGIRREIDILVTYKTVDAHMRIAVECRDRNNKDDIQWIDGLIGKFIDLPVNKVIVVSSSGFSKGADEKARAHNIDVRTLQEAIATDWPKEFIQTGIGFVTFMFYIDRIELEIEATSNRSLELSDVVVDEQGEHEFTLGEVCESLNTLFLENQQIHDQIHAELSKRFDTLFKSVADLHQDVIAVWPNPWPSGWPQLYLNEPDGKKRHIKGFIIHLVGKSTVNMPEVRHVRFGDVLATTGSVEIEGLKGTYTVTATQMVGKKEGLFIIRPARTKPS